MQDAVAEILIAFTQPILVIILDIIAIGATGGLAYYASRLFFHMRSGRFEKGWRLVTEGVVLLCAGFIFITIQDLSGSSSPYYFYFDYVGTALCVIGIIIMSIGLRSQYRVWTLKERQSLSIHKGRPALESEDGKREPIG